MVDWPLAGVLALVPLSPLLVELVCGVFHLVQRKMRCSMFTDLYFRKCAYKLTFTVVEIIEELHL